MMDAVNIRLIPIAKMEEVFQGSTAKLFKNYLKAFNDLVPSVHVSICKWHGDKRANPEYD